MALRSHIFCVPFPSSAHLVNMYHVAVTLAKPSMPVHILVLSTRKASKWLEATGHTPNDHISLQALGNGVWEDWTAQSVAEYYQLLSSPHFMAAVEAAVMAVEDSCPQEACAAMMYNAYMEMLGNLAARRGLKTYLVFPCPYYVSRLGNCNVEGESLNGGYLLSGIGGSEHPVEAQFEEISAMSTPLFESVFKPAFDGCAGVIYSNTNTGIEGDNFQQPHLPAPPHVTKPSFMIGPGLPPWFENYLDSSDAKQQRLQQLQTSRWDECIEFLHKQKQQSVVYIALGGNVELEEWQAKAIVTSLRSNKIPWILLFRNDTDNMRNILAEEGKEDGVVTEWAPQLDILVHPAVRCVITHGGFRTMMEGILTGHCFIASPVTSDQFINSKVMTHLGISLGTVAENTHVSSLHTGRTVPSWPNNSSKHIEDLFDHLFGTEDGDREIQQARNASLALRKRVKEAKKREGPAQVQSLYKHLISEGDQGLQSLFPSFMMGPW